MRLFKYPYGTGKRYRYEIEIGGVIKSPHEWARETGIPATTLVSRAKKGWLDKDMLVPPLPKGGAIKGAEGIVFDRMKNNETLCWRCQKSTGGCRWSQRLEPVDGWTAVEKVMRDCESFQVIECPEFVWDGRSKIGDES